MWHQVHPNLNVSRGLAQKIRQGPSMPEQAGISKWRRGLRRGETHVPVQCTFIILMKEPNEETLFFLVPASNYFMFWCRSCDEMMSCMMANVIRHKIWYTYMYKYIITWKLTCYKINSLIFRSRIVYRIHNLAAAQNDVRRMPRRYPS